MGHYTFLPLLVAVYVTGIKAKSFEFWRGVDMSQLNTEDGGGKAIFRSSINSPNQTALTILREEGANAFRMRVWNSPPKGYEYADVAGVLAMAKRCRAAGLDYIVDFHYSDWWADPGHQNKPASWADLGPTDLIAAVHNFTFNTIHALVAQQTPVKILTIKL